jgi:alpha/beta superfamily hydrolase
MAMLGRPQARTIDGLVGRIEVVVEDPAALAGPSGLAAGIAVVAHPHPLMGGTMDNKVVHTLVRAFVLQGWRAVRFNFRGVGQTEGVHDEGRGEVDDMLAVLAHFRTDPAWRGLPVALAGFSFGGAVAAQAHQRWLQDSGTPPEASPLVLVSPAVTRLSVPPAPPQTLVIQGEEDDVVPLAAILDWARPQGQPVTVVPGTGHFFHGQLAGLRELVRRHLQAVSAPPADAA